MVVANKEIDETKNAGKSTTISMAMEMQLYDVGRIARWSTSRDSLEATGCRHWASACARGSDGSFPPPFLFSRENQNSEEQKKRGKRDGPRTDNTTISVALFFQRLLNLPSSHNNVAVTP